LEEHLERKYEDIFEKAALYLDTRKNDIHTQIAYELARRLLSFYPEADKDVVLPAVILHDVGWKKVPEGKQVGAFGPYMNDEETRRMHEVEGARIAREILESLNYDSEKIKEILNIIDGHDSRSEAISLNDKLVKDADKLWRYSPVGFEINIKMFRMDWDKLWNRLVLMLEEWFFIPESRDLAREGLAECKRFKSKPSKKKGG
jgi:CRISPR/Cas system-associated endonuclease Cas3-HD